jgi:enoyl-CoA hydratase/carnithine racemase
MPVVLIEKKSPQITVVTLNRSERRNSLTIELLNELIAAIRVASDEPRERVLILRGAGAAFCTGLDLKEAADLKKAQMTAELVAKTLITLAETRLVTIAAAQLPAARESCRPAISSLPQRKRRSAIRKFGAVWLPD